MAVGDNQVSQLALTMANSRKAKTHPRRQAIEICRFFRKLPKTRLSVEYELPPDAQDTKVGG